MSIARMSVVHNTDREFKVIVDAYNGLSFQGVMYHKNLSKGLCFNSMLEMIINMDGVMDENGCPKQSFQMRSFQKNKSVAFVKRFSEEEEREGKLASFEIFIEYRNHASWQGTILWDNRDRKETFRSALQMVLLMNRILSGNLDNAQEPKKISYCNLEINGYETGCIVGKFHNISSEEEEEFCEPVDLAKTLGDFMEIGMKEDKELNLDIKSIPMYKEDVQKATFSIKIMFREKYTRQGMIYWHENKEQQPFRSFKEMLFMIASVVGTVEPEN